MEMARKILAQFKRGEVTADDVLNEICREVGDHLRVSRTSIWRFNAIGDKAVNVAEYDLVNGHCSAGETIEEDDYPAYFHAIKERFQVVAEDVAMHPATRDLDEGSLGHRDVGAMLDVLISVGSQPAAILCAEEFGNTRTWTASDIAYAERMAALLRLVFRHTSLQPA